MALNQLFFVHFERLEKMTELFFNFEILLPHLKKLFEPYFFSDVLNIKPDDIIY